MPALLIVPPIGVFLLPSSSGSRCSSHPPCDRRSNTKRSSWGRSSAGEGGRAKAVLLQAGDPVLEVLTGHYNRSFGKIHAVGRGDAAGAPSVQDLLDCLMCE